MSNIVPVQKIIGIEWAKYKDQDVVNALDPLTAGTLANQLRSGITASSIRTIDPIKQHPAEVQAVLDVLAALEARSRGFGIVEPKPELKPEPKARKPRRKGK